MAGFIEVILNDIPLCAVSVHAPTQITDRRTFFQDLHVHVPSCKWLIIGGDFNSTLNVNLHRNLLGIHTDCHSYPLRLSEVFRSKYLRKITCSYPYKN